VGVVVLKAPRFDRFDRFHRSRVVAGAPGRLTTPANLRRR
jgi:hypothetical protein